jgi:cardiolipin synthase
MNPSARATSWKLYTSNEQAWNSMLADCAVATESIVLEQFIFAADDFGTRLINICAERAAAGVTVRFLWDAAGSFTFWGSNIVADLTHKGIELKFWRTLVPSYVTVPNFRAWFLRDHRRTVVIDDKIGYTGSICVSDRYRNWRDTNVRLTGAVVAEMSNAFERMWGRASRRRPLEPRVKSHDPDFRYVTNYPAPGRRHINQALEKAIQRARSRICVTTPYFVPTHRLVHLFKKAALRGVDVGIILPEATEHYAVDLGARSYFHTLLESGVKIFLYQGNIIHSKSVIIDDAWSTVGTLNLDRVSLLYNFEANIISTNPAFARELAGHFARDLTQSQPVTLSNWRNRFFLEKIPELLIRLVRKFL